MPVISVATPWDYLIHIAYLTVASTPSGKDIVEVAIPLCRQDRTGSIHLSVAKFRVGDDRPVTCIQCIARASDAD